MQLTVTDAWMLLKLQSRTARLLSFWDEPTLRRFCTHCGPMFFTCLSHGKISHACGISCEISMKNMWIPCENYHFFTHYFTWFFTCLLLVVVFDKLWKIRRDGGVNSLLQKTENPWRRGGGPKWNSLCGRDFLEPHNTSCEGDSYN